MSSGYGPPGGPGGYGYPPGGGGGGGYGQPPGGGYGQPPGGGYGQPPGGGYGQPPGGGYGQPPPQQPMGYGAPPPAFQPAPEAPAPDPDRRRRLVGLWLWILGMLAGIVLNILFEMAEIFLSRNPGNTRYAVFIGAMLAFPPLIIYLFVPAIIDRFDPEPWWCLAMAFLWGAIVATGFAGMINTGFHILMSETLGSKAGEFLTPVVCAPLTE